MMTDRRRLHAELLTKSLRCFLPRGDNRLTKRNLHQQCPDIRGFLNLQKLVCGIALQTTYSRGSVVECHAFLSQESFQTHLVETLSVRCQEVVFVLKENPTEDAPHVVLQIGIEEIHGPSCLRRRKTAQHQHAASVGQERFKRMIFNSYLHHVITCLQPNIFLLPWQPCNRKRLRRWLGDRAGQRHHRRRKRPARLCKVSAPS